MNNRTSAVSLTDAQLHRLIYSNWDFQQALSALTFLIEDCDFQAKYSPVELRRLRCYETSFIVSFARPFEMSRGQTTLGLKAIGVRLDSKDTQLKDKIVSLRQKVVAHSDEDYMHYRGVVLAPFNDSAIGLPVLKYSESLHLEESDLRPIEGLLQRLLTHITKALFQVAQSDPERLSVYKTPIQPPAKA
ncbi:hypothetical protein [Sphaerotilus mobilis]|uniref:hypothetical protein n=1 Tax=Sphaerotilus mobilis TaxID=47994 RepID=UPI001F5F398A|nr:hypothetical protein [Sphaerotilus mobilis]